MAYFENWIVDAVSSTVRAFQTYPFWGTGSFLLIYCLLLALSIWFDEDRQIKKVDRIGIIASFIFTVVIGSFSIGYIVSFFHKAPQ
jgi:hypothetical protein